MFGRTIFLISLVFLAVLPTFAQGTIDKYGNFHPTEEQLAKNKRMGELLRNPTFITLRLASIRRYHPPEEPSTTPTPYTVDEWLHFDLFLTQNSAEEVVIRSSWWPYGEYRPELIRDGDPVPFSKKAQQLIDRSEIDRWTGSGTISTFVPGRESSCDYVKLEDWYESPLPVGHYQLIVRKRFTLSGDWVESNPVTFDVVASKPSEQSQLKLTLNDARESYKFGDNVNFKVVIENRTDQQAGIEISDPYYQYRPKLFRNDTLLEYQPKTAQLVRSKDRDPHLISVAVVSIDPYSSHILPRLELNEWYASLEPGLYRLTNRFRISYDGPWTKDSAEIQFRIEPKN